jgi:hypothetical protein
MNTARQIKKSYISVEMQEEMVAEAYRALEALLENMDLLVIFALLAV